MKEIGSAGSASLASPWIRQCLHSEEEKTQQNVKKKKKTKKKQKKTNQKRMGRNVVKFKSEK